MNKDQSEKNQNRIRKFCSDHSLAIIGGVAVLGVVSTIVAIKVVGLDQKEQFALETGKQLIDQYNKEGLIFYYDITHADETIKSICEHGGEFTNQAGVDILKAMLEHHTVKPQQ